MTSEALTSKPKGSAADKKKTVFLFLGLRIYMSDLLRTDYIKALSEKYRVVVFLRELDGTNDPLEEYYQSPSITYIRFKEPKSKFWTLFDVILRNELIRIFDDNPAVIWRNKRVGDRRRLFIRAIMRFLPRWFIVPRHLFAIEKLFVPGYKQFKAYVATYHPSLVLTATPGLQSHDAYAILCAKKAKIPTVAVNTSWDNLTSLPKLVRHVDYFIVWNEQMKQFAVALHGYRPDHVFVSGTPRFDAYFRPSPYEVDRSTFLTNKGLDPAAKTVVFAARSYGNFFDKFIRAFIDWQTSGAFRNSVNLLVRVHPLDAIGPYEEFMNVPNVRIERGGAQKQGDTQGGHKVEMREKDFANVKMTLKYCDVLVSIASTMSVEAMIFEKPVINIGFAEEFSAILGFLHYQPLIKQGAVRVAQNMTDVREYLQMYLHDPTLDDLGRRKIIEQLVKPTDGFSYQRNVDFLADILGKEAMQ